MGCLRPADQGVPPDALPVELACDHIAAIPLRAAEIDAQDRTVHLIDAVKT